MDNNNTKSTNKSSFSIENILEQKSEIRTQPRLTGQYEQSAINVMTPKPLSSPSSNAEIVSSSTTLAKTPDIEQYTAFKNLTVKNPPESSSATMLPHLQSQLMAPHPALSSPTAPGNLHFDHLYDPAASLFYQQVLSLQKSSAFLMPHFQAAAAAAAMANAANGVRGGANPSAVYCEPYGQFMDCEGESCQKISQLDCLFPFAFKVVRIQIKV